MRVDMSDPTAHGRRSQSVGGTDRDDPVGEPAVGELFNDWPVPVAETVPAPDRDLAATLPASVAAMLPGPFGRPKDARVDNA